MEKIEQFIHLLRYTSIVNDESSFKFTLGKDNIDNGSSYLVCHLKLNEGTGTVANDFIYS